MSRGKMMLGCIVLGLLMVFLQGVVHSLLVPQQYIPNFSLLIVIFLAFHMVSPLGVTAAFLLGLQLDFSSGVLIGPWAASFVIVFTVLSWFSRRIFMEGIIAALLVGFACACMAGIMYGFVFQQFRTVGDGFIGIVVSQAIVTGVLTPLFFNFCRRIFLRRETSLFTGRGASSFVVP